MSAIIKISENQTFIPDRCPWCLSKSIWPFDRNTTSVGATVPMGSQDIWHVWDRKTYDEYSCGASCGDNQFGTQPKPCPHIPDDVALIALDIIGHIKNYWECPDCNGGANPTQHPDSGYTCGGCDDVGYSEQTYDNHVLNCLLMCHLIDFSWGTAISSADYFRSLVSLLKSFRESRLDA